MATPREIEQATLEELRTTRTMMNGARWLLELEDEDQQTKERAALEKLRIHHAVVKLENSALRDIRDKLVSNEADLAEARDRLGQARENLEQVAQVLEAAGAFLAVVARIVPLLV